MPPAAFITGIAGQDGSYLAELLLDQGYSVHGLIYRSDPKGNENLTRLVSDEAIINKRLFLHEGACEDTVALRKIITLARPSEFYHLAGQSSPRLSLEMPEETMESVGMATVRILEILRGMENPPKFLIASSSEVFGNPVEALQTENTSMNPVTPYGAAKALGQQMCRIYRLAYGLQACSAILYNHESPRRGGGFVTMKAARAVAAIKMGKQKELILGSLSGRRDWGWAPDYVRGMYLMLQQPQVEDFIMATGRLHSVGEMVEMAFRSVDLDWRKFVKFDETLVPATEALAPCGDAAKAKKILGWECSLSLEEIMRRMVESEMDTLR